MGASGRASSEPLSSAPSSRSGNALASASGSVARASATRTRTQARTTFSWQVRACAQPPGSFSSSALMNTHPYSPRYSSPWRGRRTSSPAARRDSDRPHPQRRATGHSRCCRPNPASESEVVLGREMPVERRHRHVDSATIRSTPPTPRSSPPSPQPGRVRGAGGLDGRSRRQKRRRPPHRRTRRSLSDRHCDGDGRLRIGIHRRRPDRRRSHRAGRGRTRSAAMARGGSSRHPAGGTTPAA